MISDLDYTIFSLVNKFMNYEESIKYLKTFNKFSDGDSISRMKRILSLLDNPHLQNKYVHITGTNGKGSTSASIASILIKAGYKTGLFTSPHLHKYNERIKINDEDISDEDLIKYIQVIKDVLDQNRGIKPSIFEVICVLAFLYFAKERTDIVVLEVGIGGAKDSTNVIDSLVSIITNVALEHTEILGDTKQKIAKEKAGIIKNGSIVITNEQDKSLQAIFQKEALRSKSDFVLLSLSDIELLSQSISGQKFNFKQYKNLYTPLIGRHQLSNSALAILCAESLNRHGFEITENHIKKGLENVKWPLRLELIHKSPNIIVDAGHNIHGIRAIVQTIEEILPKNDRILILGCSYDKPYNEMSKMLSSLSDLIIITKAQKNGVDVEEILKSIPSQNKQIHKTENVKDAMFLAMKISNRDSNIMVLGGLYLAAEAKEVVGSYV